MKKPLRSSKKVALDHDQLRHVVGGEDVRITADPPGGRITADPPGGLLADPPQPDRLLRDF